MLIELEIHAAGHRLEAIVHPPSSSDLPTLVLLHEGLGSVSTWRDWPAELAAATGLGVFVYSRWGYGKSDPVTLPRPLTYMHDEALIALPQVLDAAKIERAILLGHSDGGSIAIIGADRAEALILMAAHVFCEPISVQSIAEARTSFLSGELERRLKKHHQDVDGAFWGWNGAWLDPEFMRWNIEEYLPKIAVPVLAIQGEQDPYGTLAQVDAIERGVRGKFEKLILPDCGHSPQREKREETTSAIVRFLRSII